MLGQGMWWPPVAQWLDPNLDDRLLATAVAIIEAHSE